jgi:hypothetical protein
MLRSMTFRSALAAVAWTLSCSVDAIANGPTPVDIAAANLVPALEALEKQAAVELVFEPEQIESIRTKGVRWHLRAKGSRPPTAEGHSS